MKKVGSDFKRLADITLAMAEITQLYKPMKKARGMDPKDWIKFTDQMKEAAKELRAAVDLNKPDETKKAFTKLYSSCTSCHSVFRDGGGSAAVADFVIPQKIRDSVNAMADAVGKGEKIDKDADTFFKDHKGDLKTVKWVFRPRGGWYRRLRYWPQTGRL